MVIGELIIAVLLIMALAGFAVFVIAAGIDMILTSIEDYRRIKKDKK